MPVEHTELVAQYPVDQLRPAAWNPRMMDEESYERLRRSIETFGLVEVFTVRGEDNLLIGGHQRLRVIEELGMMQVPVIKVFGLDEHETAALNIALNNMELAGEYDQGKLLALLESMVSEGFDATLTGFDEKQLEKMLTWNAVIPPTEADYQLLVHCTSSQEASDLQMELKERGYASQLKPPK